MEYVDACYDSATNAHGQFSRFEMFHNSPNVKRLHIHLERKHTVYFKPGQEKLAAAKSRNKDKKLTAFFKAKRMYSGVENVGYRDFPEILVWDKENHVYVPRAKFKVVGSYPLQYDFTRPPASVVGRIYSVSPRDPEKYFLRILLLNRPVAESYKELRTIKGVLQNANRAACISLGLLENDF